MGIVVQDSEEKGLFLNRATYYTMVISKSSSIHTCQIKVHGKLLEQMNSFVYLGSVFTSDGGCEKELKTYWNCKDSIHIYEESKNGSETWTLSQWMMKNWKAA